MKKWVCLLTLTCMFVTLIAPMSLASLKSIDQKVTLYYPNSDWNYTAIDTTLSISSDKNLYLAALQQLADPESLPVGCYDEFPESFEIVDVKINKKIAYVTLSDTAINDPNLSNGWLNNLGDIISYNLFNLDKKIETVEFLPSASTKRKIESIKKSDLFSEKTPEKIKDVPSLELDFEVLKKLSIEERDKKIQEAIDNLLVISPSSLSLYKVCIDPGHGGSDPGASYGGVHEKNLNLAISLSIQNYLSNVSWPKFDVIMTRTTDVNRTLTYRHDFANNNNANIFISIHSDASVNPSIRGASARYPDNHDVAKSASLANTCINGVVSYSSIPKFSNAQYQSIQVLRNTKMPAALVECGFMTNSYDLTALQNEGNSIGLGIGVNANFWCQVNI